MTFSSVTSEFRNDAGRVEVKVQDIGAMPALAMAMGAWAQSTVNRETQEEVEKVYQRALQVELLRRNISADLEAPIPVRYRGVTVGEYYAGLLAGGAVLVELKVALAYQKPDEAQLLNALKASGKSVGLLINFGRHKVEFRRFLM